MPDRDGIRLNRESFQDAIAPLGEHVVEQHRVEAADHQVAVRMHVVVVRHRVDTVIAFGTQQDVIRDRAAQRADVLVAQIRQRPEPRRIGVAYGEDFAEFVIRHGHRMRRPACRRVLDAAQADVGVTARDRLIDLPEVDVHEFRPPAEAASHQRGDFDVEADEIVRARRVGLDERRAAFGIASPAKDLDLFRVGAAKAGRHVRCRRSELADTYVVSAFRRTARDDDCNNRKNEDGPCHRGRLYAGHGGGMDHIAESFVAQAFRPAIAALKRCATTTVLASVGVLATSAQQNPNAVANFVTIDAPVVALTHARVIDGSGAAARANQTIVVRSGMIAELGDSSRVSPPPGATVVDLTGKSVIPGLVMVHEHLYYPTGPGVYGQLGGSFARLYLAGGVTTMRTGGNVNGIMDITVARRIASGEMPGPEIDATAPYLNGASPFLQMHAVSNADEARNHVAYWAGQGATSLKAYMQISRAALKAGIDEAHRRGMKVTGHLCSVTYAEAADLGIDNLEHGFLASTDFVADKQPDVCPGQGRGQQTVAALDEAGAPFKALVSKLVDKRVALTSTLTVFETYTPGRPTPPGLDVLTPSLQDSFRRARERVAANTESIYTTLFPKAMALERAFARAGGVLLAGTDPTGSGGVVPGYSNQRQVELLVEAGFSPLEAITIGTLNGARYLGRDARIGTIAAGKQADIVVIAGDPSSTIADIRRIETVFKRGVGFDSKKLIESVKGQAGIW